MIGVDPHKGSHTAVVIDQAEVVLGQVRVRASAAQTQRLLAWAAPWPERTWAVEGARGMGYLLAQREHPGEELPGVLAAGDDFLQRHRERQVHERCPGKTRGEPRRVQLAAPPLPRGDQPQIPKIALQLAARRARLMH